MEENTKESKRLFVLHTERPFGVSTGDEQSFLALLSQLLPDCECADEQDLDQAIEAFSSTEAMDIVNDALGSMDLNQLDCETFRPFLDGLLSGVPQDIAQAINIWIDQFGLEDIDDPNMLLKFMVLILVVVIMLLKMQMKMMQTIVGATAV
jgi:hypothetical protein